MERRHQFKNQFVFFVFLCFQLSLVWLSIRQQVWWRRDLGCLQQLGHVRLYFPHWSFKHPTFIHPSIHSSVHLCLTPVKLLSAYHTTCRLLSALITPRLKEHGCDVSAPDNELCVLGGTEAVAVRRRLLLRLTAQMSSS